MILSSCLHLPCLQNVTSSQWAGGCHENCFETLDKFCQVQPRLTCESCQIYCLEGEPYFSTEECKAKCPGKVYISMFANLDCNFCRCNETYETHGPFLLILMFDEEMTAARGDEIKLWVFSVAYT